MLFISSFLVLHFAFIFSSASSEETNSNSKSSLVKEAGDSDFKLN